MYERMHFVADQVSQLTGLSRWQLRSWQEQGIFAPRVIDEHSVRRYSGLYSFREVVILRLLALLRSKEVGLGEFRRVQPWLAQHAEEQWVHLRVAVKDRRLCLLESGTNVDSSCDASDHADVVDLAHVIEELERDVARLRERVPEDIGRVTRYRGVQGGSWVLAGTRIPTRSVWQMHQEAYTTDEILAQFPDLTSADVEAALTHEARLRQRGAA